MRLFSKILRGFAYVWVRLVVLAVIAGTVGIWITEGFSAVRDTFSPFNVWNFIVLVIAISPAFGAWLLAEKLEKRSRKAASE